MKDSKKTMPFLSMALAILASLFWLSQRQKPGVAQQAHAKSNMTVYDNLELHRPSQHEGLLQASFKNVQRQLSSQGIASSTVDCVQFEGLCDQERIPIFPTIKLAQYGQVQLYNGPREEKDMLDYVAAHT
ncbi:unnamed protein product [Jaminaea pallidilutea]